MGIYTVSKVDKHLRPAIHYARDGRTLCGRKVGTLAQRWFVRLPWERQYQVTCPRCLARAEHETEG